MKNFLKKHNLVVAIAFLLPLFGAAQNCVYLGCAANYGTQTTNGSATMIEAPGNFTCYSGYSFRQITWQYFYSPSGGNYVQGFSSSNGSLDLDWVVFDAGTSMPSITCPISTTGMTLVGCSTAGSEGVTGGPGHEGSAVSTTAGHYYLVGITFWQDANVTWTIGTPTLGGSSLTGSNCPSSGGGSSSGSNSPNWIIKGNSGINPDSNFVGTTDNKPLLLKANNKLAIRVDSNGNISIGDTINALSKLYIRPAATSSSGVTIKALSGQSNSTYLQDWQKSDGGSIMRVSSSGRIAIGTTNMADTSFKLFVESGIRTRKVKVDVSSWADYVFDNGYRLWTLEETEKFIQQHKHLPDVPSAAEVTSKGLDVGESQTLLLRKIEELTLHLIEMNKKLNELASENKDLKQVLQQTKK